MRSWLILASYQLTRSSCSRIATRLDAPRATGWGAGPRYKQLQVRRAHASRALMEAIGMPTERSQSLWTCDHGLIAYCNDHRSGCSRVFPKERPKAGQSSGCEVLPRWFDYESQQWGARLD